MTTEGKMFQIRRIAQAIVVATALACAGFVFILTAVSAQALPGQRSRFAVADQVPNSTDVTRTVFLPFVSNVKPNASVKSARCGVGGKGDDIKALGVNGVVFNPSSRPISDVQVTITLFDITGTVLETKVVTVAPREEPLPRIVLPNSFGDFYHSFGLYNKVCPAYDRIDATVTSWRDLSNTNMRQLTVIGTQNIPGGATFDVIVRNDQAVSLTQNMVTVIPFYGAFPPTTYLTQTLAPNEIATVSFNKAYASGIYTDLIIAQGQIYP